MYQLTFPQTPSGRFVLEDNEGEWPEWIILEQSKNRNISSITVIIESSGGDEYCV
jgi:hypothetical protein